MAFRDLTGKFSNACAQLYTASCSLSTRLPSSMNPASPFGAALGKAFLGLFSENAPVSIPVRTRDAMTSENDRHIG